MKNVFVSFIQDRSYSMLSTWGEAEKGFAAFVNDLRVKGPIDDIQYFFSLTVFDDRIDTPIIRRPISEVSTNALAEYGPRGNTALYDAVGRTIRDVKPAQSRPQSPLDAPVYVEKNICIIVTDGQENASKEWNKTQLRAEIERLSKTNWTFTYFGAQPETWNDAYGLGITRGSTVTYVPATAGAAYRNLSGRVHTLSSSACVSTSNLMNSAQFGDLKEVERCGVTIAAEDSNA